ncbi:hypothetical protein MMC30_002830 [Trapelia coarctata]|nr:hypothetical protein [Trapelia coarctata]
MPVITRRQPLLDLRGKTASITLSDTLSLQSPDNDPKPLYFLTDESFAKKEMEFPGSESPPRELKATSRSRSNLRLTTQSSLHSRYQSSEEDVSPSPDDSSASSSDEAEAEEPTPREPHSTDADAVPALDEDTDADSDPEYPVPMTPPAVATRISFFHAGRPKLISIAALAPMQKRKRAIPPPIPIRHIDSYSAAASRNNTNGFPSPNPSSEYHSAPTSPPAKRPTTAIRTKASPVVWLPTECEGEDAMSLSESEEAEQLLLGKNGDNTKDDSDLDTLVEPAIHDQELYFPPGELCAGSPTPTTYAEYDPYSLDPPRLSGGSSEFSRHANPYAKKYSAFSAHGYGYSPNVSVWEGERKAKGWKGLGLARVVGFGKKGGAEGKGFEVGMGKRMGEQGMLPAFIFEE